MSVCRITEGGDEVPPAMDTPYVEGHRDGKGENDDLSAGAKAAATTSQQALILGEHEVPFLSKDRTVQMRTRRHHRSGRLSLQPVVTWEVIGCIRWRNTCYVITSGIFCGLKRCTNVHGHIPSGYYAVAVRM